MQSGSTLSDFRDVGVGLNSETRYATARQFVLKETFINKLQPHENTELQKEIETPVLLAHAMEDSTDIFGISGGGGFEPPNPLGTPLTIAEDPTSQHQKLGGINGEKPQIPSKTTKCPKRQ